MFLIRLNEEEKKCFYRLAQIAAAVNGKIEQEESYYLECFRQEMALPKEALAGAKGLTEEDVVKTLSAGEAAHKRIVLFELIEFLNVDGMFDEAEDDFTHAFAKKIGFDDRETNRLIGLVERYVGCLSDIATEIF